jgi:hypothetical protein
MRQDLKSLVNYADTLFGERAGLLTFWQLIMEHFAPASADFLGPKQLDDNYADRLATSFPVLAARDFVDQMGQMLRPYATPYSEMYVEGLKDHEGLAWMQWASGVQDRAKRHRPAQFGAVMKDADRDVSLLGNAAISVNAMPDRSGLLYQGWHLRDVVWVDGIDGLPSMVFRRWTPRLHKLVEMFGLEKLGRTLQEKWRQQSGRLEPVECLHMVVPVDMYEERKFRTKYVSIHVIKQDCHELECVGARSMEYVIPRWRRVKGCQYAISPAVECALPDARLLQAMVLTMLKASEKAADPPVIAIEEIVRGDLNLYAGGVTMRAKDYDGRHEPVQPIQVDKSGLPIGLQMQANCENLIRSAFYLDKLRLPARGAQMTLGEFSERMREYIRDVSNLYAPVEDEYSGGVEERTFEVLMMNGAFGPPEQIPRALQGEDVRFRFRNPIREAQDSGKAEMLAEVIELSQRAAAIDPGAPMIFDVKTALRDAVIGKRAPMNWMFTPAAVQAAEDAQDAQAQQQAQLAAAQSASQTVANLAKA